MKGRHRGERHDNSKKTEQQHISDIMPGNALARWNIRDNRSPSLAIPFYMIARACLAVLHGGVPFFSKHASFRTVAHGVWFPLSSLGDSQEAGTFGRIAGLLHCNGTSPKTG